MNDNNDEKIAMLFYQNNQPQIELISYLDINKCTDFNEYESQDTE